MSILSFELSGDFAMWKKPYCNDQHQSFFIPTKTALVGMLAGIIGLGKDEYIEKFNFDKTWFGIEIINKVETLLVGFNYMHGEGDFNFSTNPIRENGNRARTSQELLKNVRYRIYLLYKENDWIFSEVKSHLLKRYYIYNPYLGQQSCFADISNEIYDYELKELEIGNEYVFSCVLPQDNLIINLDKIKDENDDILPLYLEKIPCSMEKGRQYPKNLSVIFLNEDNERNKIKAKIINKSNIKSYQLRTKNEKRNIILF